MRVRMGPSVCPEEVLNPAWEVREDFLQVVMSELRSKGELARRREVVRKAVLDRGAACAKRKC